MLPTIADRNAAGVARELAAVWAALGRYCKDRLGVPPEAVLAARGFRSLAGEVAAALARHPDVKPAPGAVAEYVKLLDVCWGTRSGTGDEDAAE